MEKLNVTGFHSPNEKNGYLSNWYLSEFKCNGVKFSSMEQYMMYMKAIEFNDHSIASEILKTTDVAKIKSLGRMVQNYNDTVWNGKRQIIVYEGLYAKFDQNPKLKELLLSTEDAILAECAVSDTIWGIGISMTDEKRFDISSWKGQNLLGFSLMIIRDKLRKKNTDKTLNTSVEKNIGRKPSRDEMSAVFRDTVQMIESNEELKQKTAFSMENTVFYPENHEFTLPENPGYIPVTTVSMDRSFEAAGKLKGKYSDDKISVLNFASATSPGGGVVTGARAQEESLCRCSTLYPCLNQPRLHNLYYTYNKSNYNIRYTDACIYTPEVTVIKTDTNIPERMDSKRWYSSDIITCAAPNLRRDPYAVSDDELYNIHLRRARRILSIAAINGSSVLVLGAFGCGAFKNNPETVARAYKTVLEEFYGYFRHIEFAVFVANEEAENYTVFKKYFGE